MKFKIMFALLILFVTTACYFATIDNIMENIRESNQVANQIEKVSPELIDNAPLEEPQKEIPKVVEKVNIEPVKKPQVKKFTEQEIKSAREYVGNYRYIKREINKVALKCVDEKGFEIVVCESIARKRFNMSNDPESISRMDTKYKEQLAIVQSL